MLVSTFIFAIYKHWNTGGYKGLLRVTRGYKGLQGVTKGDKGLQGVKRGDRWLQRIIQTFF